MELITKVAIAQPHKKITFKSRILMVGSCFADEVGNLLKIYGFESCINPFGTLYNPVSVINSLRKIAAPTPFEEEEVIFTGPPNAPLQLFCSFWHHSRFARPSAAEFLEYANGQLEQASAFFKEADTIIITLGTTWVFRHLASGMVVSNCHKIEPKEFRREFLQVNEVLSLLEAFITEYPDKEFFLTVSPIRHLKDGAHGNNISKATLLLAIEALQQKGHKNVDYFPAYEILLDELRDYRFYGEDMVHPSQQAVKYIFERFTDSFIAPSEYETMRVNLRRFKQSAHLSGKNPESPFGLRGL